MNAILLGLTKAFIDRYPVTARLTPVTEQVSPSGGLRPADGRQRLPQVFTLVEPSDSSAGSPVRTEQGETDRFDYLLVGEVDLQIEEGDWFVYMGNRCRVVRILPDNGYEKRATVVKGL